MYEIIPEVSNLYLDIDNIDNPRGLLNKINTNYVYGGYTNKKEYSDILDYKPNAKKTSIHIIFYDVKIYVRDMVEILKKDIKHIIDGSVYI